MGDQLRILDIQEQKDAKYCERLLKEASVKPDTTQVLLSRKGLVENCSMKQFLCLEALWLNDNNLTKVVGMDSNVQIKALHLHNNKISTLEGSLKFLRHIRILSLNNNRLQDLQATLPLMRHLAHLEELVRHLTSLKVSTISVFSLSPHRKYLQECDLSGNPLANEVNYRLFVIHTFPSLHVLDRHEITDDERIEARKMYTGMKVSKTCFGKTKPKWESAPKQEIMCLSVMTKDMYKQIEKYKVQLEVEQKAAELAAAQTLSRSQTSTSMKVPVATAVETVTMNSKTLKDLLRDFIDEESDSTQRERKGKKSGDFFAMKRFVSGTVQVSLEDSLSRMNSSATALSPGGPNRFSRRASEARSERSQKSSSISVNAATIELDMERYEAYKMMKSKLKADNQLEDWLECI